VKAAACQPVAGKSVAKPRGSTLSCRQHNRVLCAQCFNLPAPAHHCQALIAICQKCGLHHPVIADVCQFQDKTHQMLVADGTVEGQPARVVRDTGCSTVVMRRSLIPDEKLTGTEEKCILIDGTLRQTPVAKIEVETAYYSETVLVVCMKYPLYDLIVGNIQGAMDPLYKPGKKFLQRTRTNRRSQRSMSKGYLRRNINHRQQPDLNLRRPCLKSAKVRPKLKLVLCTVKNPVNAVVPTKTRVSSVGLLENPVGYLW